MIRCHDVTLGYGRDIVLENISLEIPKGIFLPVVGPNGAGKTTLMRALLGLLAPLKGSITAPFASVPAGYVPQMHSIDPLFPLTAQGIIKMGFYPRLGPWRQPGTAEKKLMEEVLRELRLTPHAHKNYRDLSGGTQQKVLIARALVSGAEVFILDEPTSELDEESEKEVFSHLERFVRQEGKTVLMVHHGLKHSMSGLAEKVCCVSRGRARMLSRGEYETLRGTLS